MNNRTIFRKFFNSLLNHISSPKELRTDAEVKGEGRIKTVSIVLVALLACTIVLFPNQLLVRADSTSNSRGIWSFDEGTGTISHDSSGNGNGGVLKGGATWVNGKVGKAVALDGTSGYVEVPDSDSLDVTGKLTLEAWIYPRSFNDRQLIICKYNHTTLGSSYYLGIGGTLGTVTYMNKVYFALTYDGNHYYAMVSKTNITANTWTHVAATTDGTYMNTYINGVKDATRTYPPGIIYAGTANLRIGCYLPEFGYARYFNGTLDEVRVAAGVVWTVDDDRVQCPNANFTKMQDAVAAANAGDTIYVHPGTYSESQITIDKAITVRGMDVDSTIIDGGNAALSNVGLVRIVASGGNVAFNDFTLRNAGGPLSLDMFMVRMGIYAASTSSDVTYRIARNKIYGTNNDSEEEDYGFYSYGGRENLVFTYNTITQTGANAILIERHIGPTDISNNVLDAGVWGADAIFTMTYGGDDITSLQRRNFNTIDMGTGGPFDNDHRSSAITFSSSYPGGTGDGNFTNIHVEGNTIKNVESYRRGISLWNGATGNGSAGNIIAAKIINNKITGVPASNNSYGIRCLGLVTNVAILANNITGTSVGIYFENAPGATANFNYIYSNSQYGIFNFGTAIVNATYNWWGSKTGPHHPTSWAYNGNPYGPHLGTGDNVSDYVLYDQWFQHTMPTLGITPNSIVCRKYNEASALKISLIDAYNVTNLELQLSFNTTLLNCSGVTWTAWGSGTVNIDETNGIVSVATGGSPKTGTTTLISIGFVSSYHHIWKDEATITGWTNNLTTKISIQSAELSFSYLPNLQYEKSGAKNIGVEPADVTYTFVPIRGDINNDGRVNLLDLTTICHLYGDKPGVHWDIAQPYDLVKVNNQDIIDIFDIIIIASNYTG